MGILFPYPLNLFDTQNAKAEKAVSEFCRTEDELIPLGQVVIRKLLGEEVSSDKRKQFPSPPVAGEIGRDGPFIAYDNGTVLDTRTGLMWAAKDNGSDIDWPGAKRYCENYRGGGYTDWRMPTLDELAGLYDTSKSRANACLPSNINHVATELIDITCFYSWASESRGSKAGYFIFRTGVWFWDLPSHSNGNRALPVRSAKGVEVTSSRIEQKASQKETPASSLPGLGKPFKDPYTGMEFVFIKGGCFEMGDTFGDGSVDENPVHEVCVDDFYLGKYEVTQAQWEKVMGNNPSHLKGKNNPVDHVSWNDVQQFIGKLNIASGREFRWGDNIFENIAASGREYRLPTEAEWEYAARSGGKKDKFSGTSREGELDQYAWYRNNSGDRTHAVGQKNPNGLGLYDMSGNVWEWCEDEYYENYSKTFPKENPKGPKDLFAERGIAAPDYRVLRGGAWDSYPKRLRAAVRREGDPAIQGYCFGLRVGLSAW